MTINGKELGNTKITFFRYITDKQGIECTLEDFLVKVSKACEPLIEKLRNIEDEKTQKTYKTDNIPAATISMLCGIDKSAENCKHKNNIIVIDIDEHDNPQLNNETILVNTCYNLFNLEYVYAVGRSCRGKGIFCIIPIADAEHIKEYFKSIQEDFKNIGLVIDQQCSNINRLRFASYDENLVNKTWLKTEDDIQIYDKVPEIEPEINIQKNLGNLNLGPNSLVMNDLFVMKALILLVVKYKYQSNDYYSWLQDGFRLACLGDTFGFFWFLQISRRSVGYKNDSEVQRKFNNCLQNTKMDRSCLSYYFSILKTKIGKNWISEVNSVEIPEKFLGN